MRCDRRPRGRASVSIQKIDRRYIEEDHSRADVKGLKNNGKTKNDINVMQAT